MRVSLRGAAMVLAGGLYFGVVGTILGLIIFLWIYGISRGSPLRFFPDLKDWGTAIVLAGMFGTPPAVATGLAAWPIRRYIRSALLFALALTPCGAAATAAYLVILGFGLGRLPMQGFVIATGALTAFCCALPYAIWLRIPRTPRLHGCEISSEALAHHLPLRADEIRQLKQVEGES